MFNIKSFLHWVVGFWMIGALFLNGTGAAIGLSSPHSTEALNLIATTLPMNSNLYAEREHGSEDQVLNVSDQPLDRNSDGNLNTKAMGDANEPAPLLAGQVSCNIGSNGRALVIRLSDNLPLGGPGPRNECFAAVAASRGGVVCVAGGNNLYGIVRIFDQQPMGTLGIMSIDECTTATRAATNGTVCTKERGRQTFSKVNIAAGPSPIASGLTLSECISF